MNLEIRPIPDDFKPTFEDQKTYVRWSAVVPVEGGLPVSVELGFSKAGGTADMDREMKNLRASAWRAMELGRLGRADLLRYCRVDRHKR